VVLKTAGSQGVTATDTATGTITGSATGIAVSAAATSQLSVTAVSGTTAGSSFSVGVTALDAYGNLTSAYAGTVHFTSSDGQAVLPANYAFVAGDHGAHTFSGVVLKTAGTQGVTATDTAHGTITGSATGIAVSAAAASVIGVAGFPQTATAGSSASVTVTVLDAYGNPATGYHGTVQFTSSDSQAALPANYTFTATDAGEHTFTGVVLKTAGTQRITATDTATHSITGSQTGIAVSAAAASQFTVTAVSSTIAGSSFNVVVTAFDPYGNVATGYRGTVQFTSSDSKAVLPANYTFTATDAGTHTFSGVVLKTAGSRSITATDTAHGSITGSATGIAVSAAATSQFSVTAVASTTAGSSFSVTVTALDAYGNIAAGYLGTVHFTSSDGKAVLPANYTFTAGDAGTHTFSGVVLKTAGNQSITATDTAHGSITGSASIAVSAAAATTLLVIAPSSVSSGVAFSVTVEAVDAYGNIATGYLGTVHFTSSDGKAVLPANYTFTSGDQGVHTFTVTLFKKGTQTLTAKDTKTGSVMGSANMSVT
jgi:FKBP-type peptidyl-prolyl cis-trans isomerase 2